VNAQESEGHLRHTVGGDVSSPSQHLEASEKTALRVPLVWSEANGGIRGWQLK